MTTARRCLRPCHVSRAVRRYPSICTEGAATQPEPSTPTREDFRRGDKVAFEDKYLQTIVGTVVRVNARTATIDAGGGNTWRVGFALLRRVIDI